jgi:hypothetical protein
MLTLDLTLQPFGAASLPEPAVKTCAGPCGEVLPLEKFLGHRLGKLRRQTHCVDCNHVARRTDADHGDYRSRRVCRRAHGDPVGAVCWWCGENIHSGAEAHADHLVPRSLGGSDEGYNLRWAHASCNVGRKASPATAEQYWRLHPEIAAACGLAA